MPVLTDAKLGRLIKHAGVLAAVWTVPVIIGSAGQYFGMMADGGRMPASHIVGNSVALWYVWIPATVAIFWAYRRFRFNRRGWLAALAINGAILVATWVGQVAATLEIGGFTGHVRQMGFWMHARMLSDLLLYDLVMYGGVVSVAFGLDLSRRYRERDLRASQLETQLERAKLEALQSQLQPHFLFNALNSIAMLVRRERKQEALDVVIGFGELLRYVLDEAGTVDVMLGEELRFVQRYLEIEQVRYGDRLRVTVAVAPDAARALAPNLVLQPLVENALKHGIARLPQGGAVEILAERRGNVLHIEVVNDGPPLENDVPVDDGDGVGLRNLRDRLSAVVGSAATLTVARRDDADGVRAVIEIPYRDSGRGMTGDTAMERAG